MFYLLMYFFGCYLYVRFKCKILKYRSEDDHTIVTYKRPTLTILWQSLRWPLYVYRIFIDSFKKIEKTTKPYQCNHDWEGVGSYKRRCTLCGKYQILTYDKFGIKRYKWTSL